MYQGFKLWKIRTLYSDYTGSAVMDVMIRKHLNLRGWGLVRFRRLENNVH